MDIRPIKKFNKIMNASDDKSILQRIVLFASFAKGKTVVGHSVTCDDVKTAISCVKALGATVTEEQDVLTIEPVKEWKDATLDCGNSATTMRLLCGILCGKGASYILTGDESLSKRPMERVCEPLRKLGANIETTDGHAPIYIRPSKLHGATIKMDIDSAQVKSAILLSALDAEGETVVEERNCTRDHTEILLMNFGADIYVEGKTIVVNKCDITAKECVAVKDISSASYFFALGALKGKVKVCGVGINAKRRGILNVFSRMGVKYRIDNLQIVCGEYVGDITVKKSKISPVTIEKEELPTMIDELPLIALACAFAKGESVIRGAEELRIKESDRLNAISELITALGGECRISGDDLTIIGKGGLQGGCSYESNDHRMVMTATVGLMLSKLGGTIKGEKNVAISFPDFYHELGIIRDNLSLAVIGKDVSRSKSGEYHKFILNEFGTSCNYETLSVSPTELENTVTRLLKEKDGFNVTIPYKKDVISYLTATINIPKEMETVNTVVCQNKEGYSTDGEGFLYSLYENKVKVKNKSVLVYGVGGAGKCVAKALKEQGAKVDVFRRNADELKKIQEYLSVGVYDETKKYDIIINATGVGMHETVGVSPLTEEQIKKTKLAIDLIYEPKESEFLAIAKKNKIRTINGEGMLFYQAYLADCIYLQIEKNKKQAVRLFKKYTLERKEK